VLGTAFAFALTSTFSAQAQNTATLGASYTTTAMETSPVLSTTGGLTLNLGLGFEYLIVGGGGGGGGNIGGGGGAGGVLTNVDGTTPAFVLSGGTAAVTVGGGGAGGNINNRGTSGESSAVFNVTAAGGGGGGFYNANGGAGQTGLNGASGGGGSPSNTGGVGGGSATGGGLGNNGGSGFNTGANGYRAGGGGGAGSAGAAASSSQTGNGGIAATSSITGTDTVYAAGGGGGTNTGINQGSGGSGIGGDGGSSTNPAATAGTASTGSGGGGGGYNGGFGAVAGGSGGSGVVIVRYRSASSLTSGGNTSGSYGDGSDDWQYERFTDVGGGTLTVSSFDASNLLATQSGVISGTGSLTYDSPGTLRLTGANTFTGNTRVAAGTLELGNALALQNSTLDLATADAGTVAFTVPGTTTYTLRGLAGSRALDIGGNTLSLGGANAVTNYSGDLSGTGGLVKNGTGTLTLSGTNSFSGGIVVNGGAGNASTLVAGSDTAFGTGPVTLNGTNNNSGSTLDLNGRTLGNAITLSFQNTGVGGRALANNNTTTPAVLNGTLSIGGENYVGGAGDITLNGVISGGTLNYSFLKQDAGTWTFANEASTFDGFYYQIGGVTEVTKLANAGEASSLGQVSAGQNQIVFGFADAGGGTIRYIGSSASTSDRTFSLRGSTAAASNTIEAAGTSAAATLTLTGGLSAGRNASYTARLAGDNAGVNEYAGGIANGSGTVALEKTGTTTWALTGANTYSGATTVSAGTLQVGNGGTAGTLGVGAVSVTSGGTLAFDRSNSLTVPNVISGAGTVAQAGSGTTSLTGTNTYTGTTEIIAGTLSIGAGSTAGAISSNSVVSIAAGASLAINRSNAITVSNTISGDGSVAKFGTGTLTLSGANSHTGGTNLSGGTLIVGSDNALGAGSVVFASAGATLETNRSIANPITMNADGTLAAGSGTIELTGNLTGTGTLTKTGTGTLTLSGSASTFTGDLVISGGAGANSIVKAGSSNAFGSGTVTILGSGGNTGSTFDLNGFSLDNGLVIGQGNSGVGNAGALQNNGPTPAILNGPISSGGEIYVGGSGNITFNGVVSGSVNPSNDYSFYKDGTGTWTFANTANTFDGFYYVFAGATEVASLANINEPSSLGQPTDANRNRVLFGFNGNGGGTLRFNGSAASTSDRVFLMAGSTAAADNTIEAAGTSAAATLTLTGGLSASRAGSYTARLAGDNAGVNEYVGVIADGSGTVALEKTGTTTWALTGTNTYSGATSVSSGTLQVGNGGTSGTLGGGAINLSTGSTLAFDRTDTPNVSNVISGTGTVLQTGSGTTTLNAANTYSGGTTLAAGTLLVGDNAALGTGAVTIAANGVTLGTTADRTLTNAIDLANNAALDSGSHALALAGVISGSGDLEKTGSGTLTLNATNTYSGITRVNAGTLALGNGGSIGASSGVSLADGTRFDVSTTEGGFILGATQTLSGGGTIAGNVTIAGTHSPGFSPGLQTFEDGLSYATGSTFVWELSENTSAARGVSFDAVDVTGGTLAFAAGVTAELVFNLQGSTVAWSDVFWTSDQSWLVFDSAVATEAINVAIFETVNLSVDTTGSRFDEVAGLENASFQWRQSGNDIYLDYTAIPEPSTVAALAGLLALGLAALRRRRR
jgi:fibronectin-binding autotransporter adhesin